MLRRPPRSTRTDTLFPYTTLFRSRHAAAHRTGADHADFLDVAQLGVLGQAVDLCGLALGEEDVALGRRLAAEHQLHELLALEREPLFERQPRRRLDAGAVSVGPLKSAPALGGHGRATGRERGCKDV